MITLRAIKMLLWAKRRRLDALEAAVAECTAAWQACADAVARTQAHTQACEAHVGRGRDAIESVMARDSFRPDSLLALWQVLELLRAALAAAHAESDTALKQQQVAADELLSTRRQLQRAELQRDRLEARRIDLLCSIDAEQEDAQDEESEEAAVARTVSRRNEAGRAAHAARAANGSRAAQAPQALL